MKRERLATGGLLLITLWSAIQYIFLQNVPEDISNFLFLGLTNLIGLAVMVLLRFRRLKELNRRTLGKGAVLALELCGFNLFLLLGSRHLDAVVISGTVSMYFVFVVPLLLLLRKRVSFRSAVAAIVAIIGLILMLGADTSAYMLSADMFYLVIADIFFAVYVLTVSEIGKEEKPDLLTISQISFAAVFSLIAWLFEGALGGTTLAIPMDGKFWVSVLFIGVFIRALYGLIQITCQSYVPPMNASLIFASEVLLTMLTNPLMSRLLGQEYTPATGYQMIGGVLFVVAVLVTDDGFMRRFGYYDMEDNVYIDEEGKAHQQSSLSRKIISMTLLISTSALLISTGTSLVSIQSIRDTTVSESTNLGKEASGISENALMQQLEYELNRMAQDKAKLASQQLAGYASAIRYAADYAGVLLKAPSHYGLRPVAIPSAENKGIWTMQASYANEGISQESVQEENALLGNMEAVFASIIGDNKDTIATIYLGTADGLLISYDPNSENVEQGNYYEYRESEWYTLGRNASGPVFTNTYEDSYGRGLTVTCTAPFVGADGTFAGCVAMDILVEDMNEALISDGIEEPDRAVLIDIDGYVIADKELEKGLPEKLNIFDEAADSLLASAAGEILTGDNGLTTSVEGEESYYIAYATVPSTGWRLCIICPVSHIIEPAVTIRENIDQNTEKVVGYVIQGGFIVIQNALIVVALLFLAVTYFVGRFSRRITEPIKQLQEDVQVISQGDFERRTQVTSDDEVGNLARSFNKMTESLQNYIEDLKEVTAREQKVASELSVATEIQAGALPNDYPAFPDHSEFDLYATMDPAREVGGDFYDYFFVDDTHLALVIADVSGKGIPAALFMMLAKTLVCEIAMTGKSPAEILEVVNNRLCDNKENMFVTVWLGIIDLTTGQGVAANAGHEDPAIRRQDGSYELIESVHSPAVAVMEGMMFDNEEFVLKPGDSLFVFTDGVPEALNEKNEFYGMERMVEALNKHREEAPKELLKSMKEEMDSFVGGAEQFDDITMLSFRYHHCVSKE